MTRTRSGLSKIPIPSQLIRHYQDLEEEAKRRKTEELEKRKERIMKDVHVSKKTVQMVRQNQEMEEERMKEQRVEEIKKQERIQNELNRPKKTDFIAKNIVNIQKMMEKDQRELNNKKSIKNEPGSIMRKINLPKENKMNKENINLIIGENENGECGGEREIDDEELIRLRKENGEIRKINMLQNLLIKSSIEELENIINSHADSDADFKFNVSKLKKNMQESYYTNQNQEKRIQKEENSRKDEEQKNFKKINKDGRNNKLTIREFELEDCFVKEKGCNDKEKFCSTETKDVLEKEEKIITKGRYVKAYIKLPYNEELKDADYLKFKNMISTFTRK